MGGTRKRGGPKPKDPAERQRNRLQINLTDAEWERVQEVAAARGESPTQLARAVLLRFLRRAQRR